MDRIKLLVVDNSIFFRELMSRYIQQDYSIEIVGKAGDAYSARDLILQYEPDVMTLDLEMPRMDGTAFLKKLLPQYYIPTIVVSNSEKRKAECLDAGAVEFMSKPAARTNSEMASFAAQLCAAIKKAYKLKHPNADIIQNIPQTQPKQSPVDKNLTQNIKGAAMDAAVKAEKAVSHISHLFSHDDNQQSEQRSDGIASVGHQRIKKSDAIIALGASTGGTEALEQVVRVFPEDTPPVVIVQHMPAGFTKLYSERLNRSCKMEVKEAEDGDRLRRGLIIIGAGEHHLRVCRDMMGFYVSSKPGEKVSGHCPSVDVMFNSVAEVARGQAIGAILTGMGRDGADGLLKMRQAGAFTIGQDKSSSVVYGMPMEAYKIGAVEVQAPLYKIADIILDALI